MLEKNRQQAGSHLILFDGVCGLCNRFNAFVLKHDKNAVFHFASIQSSKGRAILRQYGRNPDDLDTVYVIADFRSETPRLMERARAGLFVLKVIGPPWSLAGLVGLLPDRLLNFGYDCVANNRYRIFGKYDQCVLPAVENQERFIDL